MSLTSFACLPESPKLKYDQGDFEGCWSELKKIAAWNGVKFDPPPFFEEIKHIWPERFSITRDELWRRSTILDIAKNNYEFSHQKAEGVYWALPTLLHMKPKASKFSEQSENGDDEVEAPKMRSFSTPDKKINQLKLWDSIVSNKTKEEEELEESSSEFFKNSTYVRNMLILVFDWTFIIFS